MNCKAGDTLANNMPFDEQFIQFLSIKASAGSGKTYNLAKRYIDLLKLLLKNRNNIADTEPLIPPSTLNSIIAITFTNKAAIEMKERIISFLKGLAGIVKNELEDYALNTDDAKNLLIELLKNFEDFNVTTIDSFMNTLHKAFAVDRGIYPDYDITFESEKIFEEALKEVFNDRKNIDNILDFLKILLYLGKEGINGEEIIKKSLKSYDKIEIPEDILSYEELEDIIKNTINYNGNDILGELEERIKVNSAILDDIINKNKSSFDGRKIKSYYEISIEKADSNYSKYMEILQSNSLKNILKSKSELSTQIQDQFLSALKEITTNFKYYFVLKETKESDIIFKQLKILKEKEKELKQKGNIVDGSDLAQAIGEILKEDYGVPYAFCRLGEEIMHYLIDEFQDTSREQFEAITPLLENSRASGGSIFVVGDKKQSIYGWRGGDYTLFNDIDENFGLHSSTLDTNYRSGKKIVEFNNTIFGKILIDEIFLRNYFEGDEGIINEISEVYQNSIQKPYKDFEGYINIHLKYEKDEDFYRNRLIKILENTLQRGYKYSDIMILVRTNKEIPNIVEWIHNHSDFREIPFITDGNLRIMNNFNIKKILLTASYILNPQDPYYESSMEENNLTDKVEKLNIDFISSSPYEFFCQIINILEIENDIYTRRFLEEIHNLSTKKLGLREIIQYFYEKTDISITSSDEINATKIMSIHKSKGLQSKVVILPCFDWDLYIHEVFYDCIPISEIIDNYDKDKKLFVNINQFTNFSTTANNIYQNRIKNLTIEGLNLIYVALTRAERELYITGYVDVDEEKEYSNKIQSSAVLAALLNSAKNNEQDFSQDIIIDDKGIFFVCGKMETMEQESIKESKKEFNPRVYSPESIINRINKSFLTEISPEELREGRKEGTIIHNILSHIKFIENEESIPQEIEKAIARAELELDEEMRNKIHKTICDLKEYFIGIEDCWTEKEFVTKNGFIFRMDRIVKKDGKYVIIDYKTGNYNPKDREQVAFYQKLLPDKPKGVIYYLSSGEVLHV